ncbi:hypothetical protein T310_1909 [Rasamsonia emersonii CBS 393.64]|uniref:Uncharacterized protein n=1 Tax=Rasamsonia emersonii (strain ATCC 16479 / CBS 393.64 / IMI 116815) TaxID=1408163 RepID=A0A0F4Z0P1_RASE3|nr:hypothetical protein T310_1909 [Rasamsonia emersonii CBS 393.64]KKA24097.1 hypothetical protein T310_1909 [Rasamsonia emersonii CBS 393.64]
MAPEDEISASNQPPQSLSSSSSSSSSSSNDNTQPPEASADQPAEDRDKNPPSRLRSLSRQRQRQRQSNKPGPGSRPRKTKGRMENGLPRFSADELCRVGDFENLKLVSSLEQKMGWACIAEILALALFVKEHLFVYLLEIKTNIKEEKKVYVIVTVNEIKGGCVIDLHSCIQFLIASHHIKRDISPRETKYVPKIPETKDPRRWKLALPL